MKLFSSRLSRFILAILAGLVVAIIYGWYIHPSQPDDTSLAALRNDYKTDYVLMVSESYSVEKDLSSVVEDLQRLGNKEPIRYVQEAIITAQDLGYAQIDMENLAQLAIDLQQERTGVQGESDG